jgi:hypothetical protein
MISGAVVAMCTTPDLSRCTYSFLFSRRRAVLVANMYAVIIEFNRLSCDWLKRRVSVVKQNLFYLSFWFSSFRVLVYFQLVEGEMKMESMDFFDL